MRRRILGVGALLAVVIGLGVFGVSGLLRVSHLRGDIDRLQQELTTLRARGDDFARVIECYRNDPLCIEKSAREDLGMVRQGETILKFPSRQPR